jgi:MFS-type transporter involved in bile tolerance (Atg22 family)
MQRSFFISTILSNAFSCLLLLVIALILEGRNPSIGFTQDTYIFSALLSLAFAYPLWLYVPEPESDTLTEPITLATSVTAIINGAQALAKNRWPSRPPSLPPSLPPSSNLRTASIIPFCRELLKFAAASFILQDGMMCLYHISLIYGAHVGISDGNLIVGQVYSALHTFAPTLFSARITRFQVVNRLVGAISAVLWLPFSQRFGTRSSYFVSISIGVAASCVILLPMTAHLFW